MADSTWDAAPMEAIPDIALAVPSGTLESFATRIRGERERRIAIAGRRLTFGVKFLDRALGGIFQNDVILIGAKTGKGKSHLALLAAMENAALGKRVDFFGLEAEQDEFERRAKFSILSDMVRASCRASGNHDRAERMNYMDWYSNELDDITRPYEEAADTLLSTKYKSLHTFYRTTDFYAEHFEKMVRSVQDKTDLIVLDHLHFVDSTDTNENRSHKAIVKKIRDTALTCGRPVIVVAHLRKSDKKSGQLIPDEEDFHGSSDVPKMATKAIIITPARDHDSGDPVMWPTYIRPVKCRPDGSRARYIGRVMFDARNGRYVDEFDLGQLSFGEDKFELVDAKKCPRWAR